MSLIILSLHHDDVTIIFHLGYSHAPVKGQVETPFPARCGRCNRRNGDFKSFFQEKWK